MKGEHPHLYDVAHAMERQQPILVLQNVPGQYIIAPLPYKQLAESQVCTLHEAATL